MPLSLSGKPSPAALGKAAAPTAGGSLERPEVGRTKTEEHGLLLAQRESRHSTPRLSTRGPSHIQALGCRPQARVRVRLT